MRYTADREGHKWQESTGQDKLLEKLYGSAVGRCILRPLVSPVVSKLGGRVHVRWIWMRGTLSVHVTVV